MRRPRRPFDVAASAARPLGHAPLWLGVLATTPFSAAGCFIDPINRAPIVSSIESDAPVVRGKTASFTATVVEPDSDSYTLSWAAEKKRCSDPADQSQWPQNATPGTRKTVESDLTGDVFCVWAFATDRYGAVGVKNYEVDPSNQPPHAVITVLHPVMATHYPLYTTFVLSSASSTDVENDPFKSAWSLIHLPDGSNAALGTTSPSTDCQNEVAKANPIDQVQCFTADKPGQYEVRLDIEENKDSRDSIPQSFTVDADTMPCIDTTKPDYKDAYSGDPADPTTLFQVNVSDDGQPVLASGTSQVHFRWTLSANAGPMLPVEVDYPILPLGGRFQLGDTARVRVEVYDQQNREAIERALVTCKDSDVCVGDPKNQPNCFQRVTWTVNWNR